MVWDGHRRSASSPPPAATRRAAEAAAEAAAAAVRAAGAAEAGAAAVEASEERAQCRTCGGSHPTSEHHTITDAVQWPPSPSALGLRFWYARGYPGLEDGIYTTLALTNRGVDPEKPAATGLLDGFKTPEPTLRRAQNRGVSEASAYWR